MSRLTPNQRALVRTDKLGFVFQSFNLLPRTTALQNVMMPLDYCAAPARQRRGPPPGADPAGPGRAGRPDGPRASQMSGGQQQRVAIARSLVNRPALLLADEPTGNLDSHTSVEILRMFQQLNAEGITVILVTHDPKVAAYAHRTIRIADGRIEGDEVNPRGMHVDGVVFGGGASRIAVPHAPALNGGDGNGAATATTEEVSSSVAVAVDARSAPEAAPEPRTPCALARLSDGDAAAKPRSRRCPP